MTKTLTVRFHHRLYGSEEYADGRDLVTHRGRSTFPPQPSQKLYDYLYTGGKPVKPGDIALVIAPNTGYTAVTVVSVSAGSSSKATKYVLDVFDPAQHAKDEAERAHKAKRIKELEALIEKKIEASLTRKKMEQFRFEAGINDELNELDALTAPVI